MKKLVVLCVFFVEVALLVPRPLAAEFGVKGGVNISKYAVTADPGYEWISRNLTGFMVGAFYTFSFGPKFAIQPEAYYATNGEKESFPEDSFIIYKERLNYIHVPVLFKFKFGEGG
ncbi:MAG: outer membrane beta-barrel protein, partial [Chrysiogenales bacterium]